MSITITQLTQLTKTNYPGNRQQDPLQLQDGAKLQQTHFQHAFTKPYPRIPVPRDSPPL
jgi:hypothetical protein